MNMLWPFFGMIYLLVLVACGLVWMFSPSMGHVLAKRGAVSFLLFVAATMALPSSTQGTLSGGVHLVLSFLLLLASIFCLFQPQGGMKVLGNTAAAGTAVLVMTVVLAKLWSTVRGRLFLLGGVVLVAAVLHALRKPK